MDGKKYEEILQEVKKLYYEKTIKAVMYYDDFMSVASTCAPEPKPIDKEEFESLIRMLVLKKGPEKTATDWKFNQELWGMAAKYILPNSYFSAIL